MLHVLYAYEPVMGRDPFTDRYEHCATWSCDCGASGEGDPYECATCGCEARTVDGPLWWDVYLRGRKIDSVPFDANIDEWHVLRVLRSLVGHDWYDPAIQVKRRGRV